MIWGLMACVRLVPLDPPPTEMVSKVAVERRDCRPGTVVNLALVSGSPKPTPAPCDLPGAEWTERGEAGWSLDYTVPEPPPTGELRGTCPSAHGVPDLEVVLSFDC